MHLDGQGQAGMRLGFANLAAAPGLFPGHFLTHGAASVGGGTVGREV